MAKTRADLMLYLDGLGIATTLYEHPAVYTVAESLAVEHSMPGGHTKNLFLKDKKDRLFLVVALHTTDIDLKTLPKRIGSDRLSFGKPELLETVLGVKPGSVNPFALINDSKQAVTVILDASMMAHDLLNYHPLENTATLGIARDDLLRFIRATGHEPAIVEVAAPAASST
jgi:Ala-tRNA(Pro) deacylase